ncbi:MAG: UvrD-helicase domain-containing protein [Xanthomonadales bacterium]|jgi:exodeoxyribonuclease V beta subunit|nr:UvrD-helicase domain-containing protein [Xanthomonadales bacterium]
MTPTLPEVCAVPLEGIQLVEASAGTGKTHVIVGLYLRALAVLGLPVESLLLVSYTVAATAELRLRVQRRLLDAAALAAQAVDPPDADPELAAILAEARAAQAESASMLGARLARTARALDRARIQTIHGWARGVAADEALALGLPLGAVFVEDESAAARQALADAWRAALEAPTRVPELRALGGPQTLWESHAAALLAPGEAALDGVESTALPLLLEARRRLLQRRALQGRHGVDEVLERLSVRLAGPAGAALAQRLAARHPLVLIDEFQDADARQYTIFRTLQHAGGRALLLVGDPKQAIYRFRGGDVDTYLAARRDARLHRLQRNWRARPALIAGLNALYAAAGPRAFDDGGSSGIRYEALIPAGRIRDAALHCAHPGLLPAALCFAHLPGPPRVLGDRAAGEQLVARHAAQQVADWLAAAAAGELCAEAEPPRIAVLAENHAQLDQLAAALTALGVPLQRRATRPRGRAIELDGLACWLAALIEPLPERGRALEDTPLGASDPGSVPPALVEAAARLRGEGVVAALLAWLESVAAECPPATLQRLLALAEALQRQADATDPQALLDLLIREASALWVEPEPAEPGPRVVLSTVHAAKGLEFDLVLLPFTGARARGQQSAPLPPAETRAQREERLRNLYVALTRARLGVVVGLDLLGSRNDLPALYHLLGADETSGSPAQAARRAVEALSASDSAEIRLMVWPQPETPGLRRATPAAPLPAVHAVRTPPPPAPALASYSSLLQRVDPEPAETPPDVELAAGPGGAAFGSAVHAVLEHADFAAWAGSAALPATEAARVQAILARLPSLEDDHARRCEVEAQARAALNTPLPEGLRLCELPAGDRRAELAFTLKLRDPEHGPAELARLALTLRPPGITGMALQPVTARVGWLTGIIDLVYRHAGRWYLIDWKSNRLRHEQLESPDGLARAVADSGYELQMLLYAVALDRWLAQRLPGYQRESDFGGVRWLYLRGLRASDTRGIHAPTLPDALLDAAGELICSG